MPKTVFVLALSYLLGTWRMAPLIGRLSTGLPGEPPSSIIGAIKHLGFWPVFLITILEVAKAWAVTRLAIWSQGTATFGVMAAVLVVMGTFWPWFDFKPYLLANAAIWGVLLALNPIILQLYLALWLSVLLLTGKEAAANLISAASLPVWAYYYGANLPFTAFCLLTASLVFINRFLGEKDMVYIGKLSK